MPEQDVAERLTSFYRAVDEAIPDRPVAWRRPDDLHRPAHSWRMQLLATAALLLLIVVLGFLIREARLHQATGPAKSSSLGALPQLITLVEPVQPMGLEDGQHGWVVSGSHLLVTADGGRRWRDGSPPGTQGSCCAVSFLDARHGWAGGAYSSSSRMLEIFKTTDGGTTWRRVGQAGPTASVNPCCPTLSFVDDQHGWLMYQDLVLGGETVPVGRLVRTADGGATWSFLPDLPFPPATDRGGVLRSATLARFVSTAKGWYVGINTAGNEVLYVTSDGGRSWKEQAVPVPASEQLATRHLTIPVFLRTTEGVLPVTLADGIVLLEFSSDGGATWQMDLARAPLFHRPPAQTAGQNDAAPTFVGSGVIAVVLGNQLELNTGNRWTSTTPSGLPGVIVDIKFANAQLGWALSTQAQCEICGSNDVVLMKTTDGGATWIRLGS